MRGAYDAEDAPVNSGRARRNSRPGTPSVRRRARGLDRAGDAVTVSDLDDLDQRIVGHLQDNGRLSNAAIARALGVTEATVRHRIERLISNGFIRVTAVINPRKTPYQVDVIIWMRLERGKARAAAERIARYPNVIYVGLTTGRYDLLVEALFESDEALFEFLTRKLSRALGVVQSETYHVLRTVKINYDWKLPLSRPARSGRGERRRAGRVAKARPGNEDGATGGRRDGQAGDAFTGNVRRRS